MPLLGRQYPTEWSQTRAKLSLLPKRGLSSLLPQSVALNIPVNTPHEYGGAQVSHCAAHHAQPYAEDGRVPADKTETEVSIIGCQTPRTCREAAETKSEDISVKDERE